MEEEFSDVEEGEEPYYPETARVHITTTRLAPIWHNPTLPYWYHPDYIFRSSVVSFQIRLKLAIRIRSARPS